MNEFDDDESKNSLEIDSTDEESSSESESESNDDNDCDQIKTKPKGNRFIDIELFAEHLQANLVCRSCHKPVELFEVQRKGLAIEFVLECSSKGCRQPVFSSANNMAKQKQM